MGKLSAKAILNTGAHARGRRAQGAERRGPPPAVRAGYLRDSGYHTDGEADTCGADTEIQDDSATVRAVTATSETWRGRRHNSRYRTTRAARTHTIVWLYSTAVIYNTSRHIETEYIFLTLPPSTVYSGWAVSLSSHSHLCNHIAVDCEAATRSIPGFPGTTTTRTTKVSPEGRPERLRERPRWSERRTRCFAHRRKVGARPREAEETRAARVARRRARRGAPPASRGETTPSRRKPHRPTAAAASRVGFEPATSASGATEVAADGGRAQAAASATCPRRRRPAVFVGSRNSSARVATRAARRGPVDGSAAAPRSPLGDVSNGVATARNASETVEPNAP